MDRTVEVMGLESIFEVVTVVRTEGRAPVYADRTVEVMGLESIFEEAAWNGSEIMTSCGVQ